jgi:hypothetical protein
MFADLPTPTTGQFFFRTPPILINASAISRSRVTLTALDFSFNQLKVSVAVVLQDNYL